jgi:UDP-glucose 4-epimerase
LKEPVLVTGAAGFIGMHVARRLLSDGHEVVGLDNLNAYYDPRLKEARIAELAFVDGKRLRSSSRLRRPIISSRQLHFSLGHGTEIRCVEIIFSGYADQREQGIAPGIGERRFHSLR